MSEPTSGVPEDSSNAGADEAPNDAEHPPSRVDLDVDEEKLEKWDEVKSDYQVNPDGKAMPNVWDAGEDQGQQESEADAQQREEVNEEDTPEVFASDSDEDADEGEQST